MQKTAPQRRTGFCPKSAAVILGWAVLLSGPVLTGESGKPDLQTRQAAWQGEVSGRWQEKVSVPSISRLPGHIRPAANPLPFPRNEKVRIRESKAIPVAERVTVVQPVHQPPAPIYKPLKIVKTADRVRE